MLWGDHGWHLGEHGIWGKHCLFEEALRSPLIIKYPAIKEPGERSDAVVETLDLLPTLCELTGIETPEFGQGVSLLPQLRNPQAEGHTAYAYQGNAKTLRTETHRLILHKDGFAELYDHRTPELETKNVAKQFPELVAELKQVLTTKGQ